MDILLLAPQPFFQLRGTPIAIRQVLRVLSERPCTTVDVLTYAEGTELHLPGVTCYRTPDVRALRGVRPGFSLKKIGCDMLLFNEARKLLHRRSYDLIHAGEEAVFIALWFKRLYGIPYAYDMDSSLAQQLLEKRPALRAFCPVFCALERSAVRESLINLPVCNALADLCRSYDGGKTVTLHDTSLLRDGAQGLGRQGPWSVHPGETVVMYVGNLEEYQGIDLLLKSFRLAAAQMPALRLVIVGGSDDNIKYYRSQTSTLGITDYVRFLGPRPLEQLGDYLRQADILVSPRIRGINTPMKVFSFMHSGKPLLATNIHTHTQILHDDVAYLAAPNPQAFGEGMARLARDQGLRERLGRNGRDFVERNHTFQAHRRRLNAAYDWIEHTVTHQDGGQPALDKQA